MPLPLPFQPPRPAVHVTVPGPTLGETKSEWLLPHVQTDPGGHGIIYENQIDGKKYWVVPRGAPVPLDVWGPSSYVNCWVAGQALFKEWHEEGHRFTLVDLKTGRRTW